MIKHISMSTSDHDALLLQEHNIVMNGYALLQFGNDWRMREGCSDVIRRSWSDSVGHVVDRLGKVAVSLQNWSREAQD